MVEIVNQLSDFYKEVQIVEKEYNEEQRLRYCNLYLHHFQEAQTIQGKRVLKEKPLEIFASLEEKEYIE